MGLPELKEEKGDKVYWCVRVQWWVKVRKHNAWQMKEDKDAEEIYASSITDVVVAMASLMDEEMMGYYVPTEECAKQINETVALWK